MVATHAIIGTAGHIDHGKTELVKALTGQDTDRLKEEKERGISIDLGFAYVTLPDGRRAGVIDVPGHERFIHNMLAGAHGVDLALFVVAADDGVMPQSEEHFDLLHLLGVHRGIFVITKADLAGAARIAEVEEEIRLLAEDTPMADAPILAVSALTGAGIDALRAEIAARLRTFDRRRRNAIFRLPVDRAFVMKGHGTVVTGTAMGSSVRAGQKLRLLPGGSDVRLRAIEVHSQPVDSAQAGQRVALNLSGAERMSIARGAVVAEERLDFVTDRLDARLEVRAAARHPLASNAGVRLFIGTSQALGRVIVLEAAAEVPLNSNGLVQIVLEKPVVALSGDHFVIRDLANQRTMGGGIVLNPLGRRNRRPRELYRERLTRLEQPFNGEVVAALLNLQESFALSAARIALLLDRDTKEIFGALDDPGLVSLPLGEDNGFTTRDKWEELKRLAVMAVEACHRNNPLAPGLEMEMLRVRLPYDIPARAFRAVVDRLCNETCLVRDDSVLKVATHQVRFAGEDRILAERLAQALDDAGLHPPDVRQLADTLGLAPNHEQRVRILLAALERQGRVAKLAGELYMDRRHLDVARARLLDYLARSPGITAAGYRDLLAVSRKSAISLLEYFDQAGVTTRVGDERRLRIRDPRRDPQSDAPAAPTADPDLKKEEPQIR